MITRTTTIIVTPTAKELAKEFCGFDAEEQAEFFNTVGVLAADWASPLCFQLQAVTDSAALSSEGRRVMGMIGEYADPTK